MERAIHLFLKEPFSARSAFRRARSFDNAVWVKGADPAVAKKTFKTGLGDNQVAGSATNAQFLIHAIQAGFANAQEMPKFPTTDAVGLAGDVVAFWNNCLDDGVNCQFGNRGGIVDFLAQETEVTFNANAAGDIPDP